MRSIVFIIAIGLSPFSSISQKAVGKFTDVNGIKVYYEEYGTGEPLLLIHGNSQSINAFKNQIPALAEKFRVVAMDSRGQGRSTENGERLTYELMAEDVNAFLDKLGLANIRVLGWSDGGNIGLILAMKHPEKVKKLAIMGANLYNDQTSVKERVNKRVKATREKIAKENKPGTKFELQLMDLILTEPKIDPDALKAIQCPVLVMAGSDDIIKEEHTKLIAARIKKSRVVIFENGTHFEPQQNPGRFNNAVLEFLQER